MGTHGTPTSALVPRRVIRALCVRPGTGRRLSVRLMGPRQHLDAEGRTLTQKVADLERPVHQDSRNSHKPPSSDGYQEPAPKSLRKKSGKRTQRRANRAPRYPVGDARPSRPDRHSSSGGLQALRRAARGHIHQSLLSLRSTPSLRLGGPDRSHRF